MMPSSTSILDRAAGYMDHLIKEATDIRLNFNNFNRECGFRLRHAWYPVINMLHNQKAGPGRASS
jgi:hypothetical protein